MDNLIEDIDLIKNDFFSNNETMMKIRGMLPKISQCIEKIINFENSKSSLDSSQNIQIVLSKLQLLCDAMENKDDITVYDTLCYEIRNIVETYSKCFI